MFGGGCKTVQNSVTLSLQQQMGYTRLQLTTKFGWACGLHPPYICPLLIACGPYRAGSAWKNRVQGQQGLGVLLKLRCEV